MGRDSPLTPPFLQFFVSVRHFESFLLFAFHIEANEFKNIQTLFSTRFFRITVGNRKSGIKWGTPVPLMNSDRKWAGLK